MQSASKFLDIAQYLYTLLANCSGVVQRVQQLGMGWTLRGSNAGGGEIFRTLLDWSWSTYNLLHNG